MDDTTDKKEGQKNRVKIERIFIVFLKITIGLLFGLFGGVCLGEKLLIGTLSFYKIGAFFLFLLVSFFITVNVHEMGHFLYGKIRGYRFFSYQMGIFSWKYENGTVKFSILPKKFHSAFCAMLPPEFFLTLSQQALFYAGGILATLVFGVLCMIVGEMLPSTAEYGQLFVWTMGSVSLFLGITNSIPFFSRGNPTDGEILWSIFSKQPFAEKLIQNNRIATQLLVGIRPKDWVLPILEEVENGKTPEIFDGMAVLFAYWHAIDAQEKEKRNEYATWMEKNLSFFPSPMIPIIYYELCYVNCVERKIEKAKWYYEKSGKVLRKDYDLNGCRIKAYYAFYVTDEAENARLFCEKAQKGADKFPVEGQRIMEKALIHTLLDTLGEREKS